jgi:putative redox protein
VKGEPDVSESRGFWKGGMAFRIEQDGHEFVLDSSSDSGGGDSGPRPKGLLLSGLLGCTGMDIVSILRKMRVEGFEFELAAEADSSEDPPVVFTAVRLVYLFRGRDLPHDKIERAVALSQERYCGVSAMLRRVAPLTWEIRYAEA